jgi:hypothetical protein
MPKGIKMYLNMLYKFVKQHEGIFPWVGGFSSEQRVAMSAFASWLDSEAAQQSVPQTCVQPSMQQTTGVSVPWCKKCNGFHEATETCYQRPANASR